MQQLTIERLIQRDILIKESLEVDTLKTCGFVCYVVNPEYVILTISQQTNDQHMVTYVQFIAADAHGPDQWVVQLQGCPEAPNSFPLDSAQDFAIFMAVNLLT